MGIVKGGGGHGALKIELFCVEKISKSSVECFLHVDDDVKSCLRMKFCFSYFNPRLFHPLRIRQVRDGVIINEIITFAQAQNNSFNYDKHSLCNAPTQKIINKRKKY